MWKTLHQIASRRNRHRSRAVADEALRVARALQARISRIAGSRTVHPSRRRRLVQRLRAGDPRAQQSHLQHRRTRHPLRRESSPRRSAARHRPGVTQHGDRLAADLRRDARSEAGRGHRRLRLHWRHLRRELRERRCGGQRHPRRRRSARLPADSRRILQGILTAVSTPHAKPGARR